MGAPSKQVERKREEWHSNIHNPGLKNGTVSQVSLNEGQTFTTTIPASEMKKGETRIGATGILQKKGVFQRRKLRWGGLAH